MLVDKIQPLYFVATKLVAELGMKISWNLLSYLNWLF